MVENNKIMRGSIGTAYDSLRDELTMQTSDYFLNRKRMSRQQIRTYRNDLDVLQGLLGSLREAMDRYEGIALTPDEEKEWIQMTKAKVEEEKQIKEGEKIEKESKKEDEKNKK